MSGLGENDDDDCRTRSGYRERADPGRATDQAGYVRRDGVNLYWEMYGSGDLTVFLMPTWSIIHSRHWKMQIPYLARHCRVLTFDGRGNRPLRPSSRARRVPGGGIAADALAVLDATATERAVVVSLSRGAERSLLLAAQHPDRVEARSHRAGGAAAAGCVAPPSGPGVRGAAGRVRRLGEVELALLGGELRGLPRVLLRSASRSRTRRSSARMCSRLGLETTPRRSSRPSSRRASRTREECAIFSRVDCPVLVIHGSDDAIRPCACARLAELAGGELVVLEGSGHFPACARPRQGQPAAARLRLPAAAVALGARQPRRKRALYVSSPIGLGHAQRDAAIADELRRLHPELEIDWLAQHPVTAVLEARGERIHPASHYLANESGHVESESSTTSIASRRSAG